MVRLRRPALTKIALKTGKNAMSQNKMIVKRLCLASAGIASVALGSVMWFVADAGVVVGQTPAPQDVPALPTPVDPSPVPGAPAAVQFGAAPQYTPQTPAVDSVPALRARIAQLQATLQKTPVSAQEQVAQQKTISEISSLQAQIQQLETSAGQYSAYRQARDAQARQSGAVDPTGPGAGTAGDLYAPSSRQGLLDASGLNSANLGNRIGAGVALTPGEASLLREQKEGLTQQYRQIQQTLRALQPGDEALAENLRQEQETLLSQLKEIDARLVNAPAQVPTPANPDPTPNFVVPPANQLNFNAPPADNVLERVQKANQAVQLLREAGLVQLAGHVANELPRMASPNFTETNLVAGTWAQGSGLADEANNPFHTVSPKDIQGINDSIGALKSRIEELSQKLADVETQLKLLTRQQVSGYISQPQQPEEPVQNAEPASDQPLDAPGADESSSSGALPDASAARSNDSLQLGEFRALTDEDYRALLQ